MASIFDQLIKVDEINKQQQKEKLHSNHFQAEEIAKNEATITADNQNITLKQVKEVSQQLLKYGLIESSAKQKLYQTALTYQLKINEILEPLDLSLKIDNIRGLAFLIVVDSAFDNTDEDQWSHPLIRRQRLNLEQSLLIAILRKTFVAHELEAGIGDHKAIIHLDELLPELNAYLGEMGSEAREDKRLRNLLEQLKHYGIVTDINEHEQVTIRPLIAHVTNPENLKNLLISIQQKATQTC